MNPMKRAALTAALAVAFLALTMSAFADPIGTLNIANCSGGGVTVDATHITWLPSGTVAGTGCFNTGAGTNVTSSLGTLLPGATGNIKNLTAGGPSPVDQFMTFLGPAPPLDFVLTALEVLPTDKGTNCAATTIGQTCVVFAGSPFVLTNLGHTTGVSLSAVGTVADATSTSSWNGAFTTQLAESIVQVQSTILGGGSITSTYSASFQITPTSTPEPASTILLGSGLATLALRFRRKIRK